MKKFNQLLEFLVENKNDNRISIFKKMKYGHRYYTISFLIDDMPNNLNQSGTFQFRDSMEITFDNRNECIEIHGGIEDYPLIVEDKALLKKWSEILELIVSENIEERAVNIFEKTLNECYNKNLYRELQMKKLFKEDESI